jgi:octaprenyl-diphosphate synthase
MNIFIEMFDRSLSYPEGMLNSVLQYIRKKKGKFMRPMLIFLMAKNYGEVNKSTYHAGIGLELLHTASLVHDDVVDEANKRRGQSSVNAVFDNKVAVLVGDYILSTALLNVCSTGSNKIVERLSLLGKTLAEGEILQISTNVADDISERAYYEVIGKKTAALFEACSAMGAMSAKASAEDIEKAALFGNKLGVIFQIRDDIFDYFDSNDIGKPTGNDMREGKLTLPVIHVLLKTDNKEMLAKAHKVKNREASSDDIASLVRFTKEKGGIDYAEQQMKKLHDECMEFIGSRVRDKQIGESLTAYLNYVIERKK